MPVATMAPERASCRSVLQLYCPCLQPLPYPRQRLREETPRSQSTVTNATATGSSGIDWSQPLRLRQNTLGTCSGYEANGPLLHKLLRRKLQRLISSLMPRISTSRTATPRGLSRQLTAAVGNSEYMLIGLSILSRFCTDVRALPKVIYPPDRVPRIQIH